VNEYQYKKTYFQVDRFEDNDFQATNCLRQIGICFKPISFYLTCNIKLTIVPFRDANQQKKKLLAYIS